MLNIESFIRLMLKYEVDFEIKITYICRKGEEDHFGIEALYDFAYIEIHFDLISHPPESGLIYTTNKAIFKIRSGKTELDLYINKDNRTSNKIPKSDLKKLVEHQLRQHKKMAEGSKKIPSK